MEESMIIDAFPGDFHRKSKGRNKKLAQGGYRSDNTSNILKIDCGLIRSFLHVIKSQRLTNRVRNTVFHLSNISLTRTFNRLLDHELFNNFLTTLIFSKRANIETCTFQVFGKKYHLDMKLITGCSKIIKRKCNFAYISPINGGNCGLVESNKYFYVDTQGVQLDFTVPEEMTYLLLDNTSLVHSQIDNEIIDVDNLVSNNAVPQEHSNLYTFHNFHIPNNSQHSLLGKPCTITSQNDNEIIDVDDLDFDDAVSKMVLANSKRLSLHKACTIISGGEDQIIDLDDLDMYNAIPEEPSKFVVPKLSLKDTNSPIDDKPCTSTIQKQTFNVDDSAISHTPPIKRQKLATPLKNSKNLSLYKPFTITSRGDDQIISLEDFDLYNAMLEPSNLVLPKVTNIPNNSEKSSIDDKPCKIDDSEISYTPPIKKQNPNTTSIKEITESEPESKKRGRRHLESESEAKRQKVVTKVREVRGQYAKDSREISDNNNPAWRRLRARNPEEALDMVKREWNVHQLSNPHVNRSHCFIQQEFYPIAQSNNGNNRTISCLSVFDLQIAELVQKLKDINSRILKLYKRLDNVYEYSRAYYSINKEIETLINREKCLNNRYGAVIDARTEIENLYKFYASGRSNFVANVPEVDRMMFDQYDNFYRH